MALEAVVGSLSSTRGRVKLRLLAILAVVIIGGAVAYYLISVGPDRAPDAVTLDSGVAAAPAVIDPGRIPGKIAREVVPTQIDSAREDDASSVARGDSTTAGLSSAGNTAEPSISGQVVETDYGLARGTAPLSGGAANASPATLEIDAARTVPGVAESDMSSLNSSTTDPQQPAISNPGGEAIRPGD